MVEIIVVFIAIILFEIVIVIAAARLKHTSRWFALVVVVILLMRLLIWLLQLLRVFLRLSRCRPAGSRARSCTWMIRIRGRRVQTVRGLAGASQRALVVRIDARGRRGCRR